MEQQACFDQSDVFTFLADPATHELREPVIRIDTHGAAVFLAGERNGLVSWSVMGMPLS